MIERYWWLAVLVWFFTRKKAETKSDSDTPVMSVKPKEEVKTMVKEVIKPVYVDTEAIERADDVAVTVKELNAQTNAIKYAPLQPTKTTVLNIPQSGFVKPLINDIKYDVSREQLHYIKPSKVYG